MDLDRQQLQTLLQKLVDEVAGDWLLVGGGVIALALDARRTTGDLDLVGLAGTAEERYALHEFCHRHQLPIETMNSAADFFVHQIQDWRSHLLPLLQGQKGRIFRPTATLLIELKMRRLAPQDLEDCIAVLQAESADKARLHARLVTLPATEDADLRARRAKLAALLV